MATKSYVYESDTAANSYLIRIDTDQAVAAGAVVGTVTNEFHVTISGSRRKDGLRPRFVTASREEGTAQDGTGKIHSTRFAVCTVTAFNALVKNAAISINGENYKISGKQGERLN